MKMERQQNQKINKIFKLREPFGERKFGGRGGPVFDYLYSMAVLKTHFSQCGFSTSKTVMVICHLLMFNVTAVQDMSE
jgi:hypothetical protein